MPTTVEEWAPVSSTKMRILIQLCQYHMASPGRPPLQIAQVVDPDTRKIINHPNNTLIPVPGYIPDSRLDVHSPDKILVYSAYPFHNAAFLIPVCLVSVHGRAAMLTVLCQILELHGIKTLELNGFKTKKERAAAIKQFHDSAESVVLIVSNVANVGLNLQCANILIILVCAPLLLHVL